MDGTIRVAEALQRVKGVFIELPGTALSVDQASQLSGLEQDMCESILLAREDAHYLKRAGTAAIPGEPLSRDSYEPPGRPPEPPTPGS